MSEDALRVAIIVLGLVGATCLSALLVTPAPKHAIVKAFIVAALCRSIIAVVPPILYQVIPEKLSDLPNHVRTEAFCVADAILLRYFTATMAAFSISFTLPLLYLTFKVSRRPHHLENDYSQPFYRRTTLALVLGPFVWALPVVFSPLPQLRLSLGSVKPQFDQGACMINDPTSSTLALIFAIIPLAFATSFSVVFLFFLWHTIKLPLSTHNLGLLDVTRLVRFAILLLIFIISVTLDSIITATWVRWKDDNHTGSARLHTLLRISLVWESVTPILYFLIFAAHEEIFSVWRSRALGFLPTRSSTGAKQGHADTSFLMVDRLNNEGGKPWWKRTMRGLRGSLAAGSATDTQLMNPGFDMDDSRRTTIPQRILQRPLLHHRNSSHIAIPPPAPDIPSLLPPPRPVRSRSVSPEEPTPGLEKTLVSMPSLTAFGSSSAASLSRAAQREHGPSRKPSTVKGSKNQNTRPSTGESAWTEDTEQYDDGRSSASVQSCLY